MRYELDGKEVNAEELAGLCFISFKNASSFFFSPVKLAENS